MLNTNNNYSNTQNFEFKPVCGGTLQKSHPKSFFVVCHVNSEYKKNYVDKKPNVLQLMVFGMGDIDYPKMSECHVYEITKTIKEIQINS